MVAENKCMVGYLEIVEYIKEKTGLETSEENNEEAEKEKATNSDSETPVEQ